MPTNTQAPINLLDQLEQWYADGFLEAADVEFVHWLHDQMNESDPAVLLAATLLSQQSRGGHVALPIADGTSLLGQIIEESGEEVDSFDELLGLTGNWQSSLSQSALVGSQEDPRHPLINDRGYLYLQRYWCYETQLAERLQQKANQSFGTFDTEVAVEWISKLLPEPTQEIPWQKVALWAALRSQLLVLTGGPGTGKTYTIVRLMALHQLLREEPLHIALAAPTGKAAARINESIANSLEELRSLVPADIITHLPSEAQTIHRLLGSRWNSPDFRHNGENPLPHDVIIVDEASMVDLALMTKLMDAVKDGAQLILIGDKDQLASVEAGSVLGDICSPPISDSSNVADSVNRYSASFVESLQPTRIENLPVAEVHESALLDCMVQLTESRRFAKAPEIGNLAHAINQGRSEQALELLQQGTEVSIQATPNLRALEPRLNGWSYLQTPAISDNLEKLFAGWRAFQILSAHRRGPGGADRVNQYMDQRMRRAQGYDDRAEWYSGRPIMVTQNNYELNLFNGDIGITVRDPKEPDQLRVCFEGQQDGERIYRQIAPSQLNQYESAWALTVHKSQGSEFDDLLLVLPDRPSPILTRELVYTALTRARSKFTVWGKAELFKQAVQQRIQRTSALGERLWK